MKNTNQTTMFSVDNMSAKLVAEQHKARLLSILTQHIGEEHKMDMGDLYCRVFDKEFNHKINDTKPLRALVTELRNEGVPIGSKQTRDDGGYWLIRSGSEFDDYCRRIHMAALKKLKMESRLKKMSMEELLGQMIINLRGQDGSLEQGGVNGKD